MSERVKKHDKDEWIDRRVAVYDLLKALSTAAQNYHSSQSLDRDGRHSTRTWRTCMALTCKEARETFNRYEHISPLNHNPYALRNWHRKIQKEMQERV